jgi:hypothetical protein
MAGGITRKCVQLYDDAVVFFNNKLSMGIDSFKQNFPSSNIVYMDIYNPILDIIVNYQKYGNSKFPRAFNINKKYTFLGLNIDKILHVLFIFKIHVELYLRSIMKIYVAC